MKKIIVTGSAGFIGSAVTTKLLQRGDKVYGIDNHNDYYEPQLKLDRLKLLSKYENYTHVKGDLADKKAINELFSISKPWGVVNLAAQAGVRYSLENPTAYIDSNIVGFSNILENCRKHKIKHLIKTNKKSNKSYEFVGPICESTDTFATLKNFQKLNEKEYIIICDVGAYGMSLASNYNLRPKALELLIKNSKIQILNKRQKISDLM